MVLETIVEVLKLVPAGKESKIESFRRKMTEQKSIQAQVRFYFDNINQDRFLQKQLELSPDQCMLMSLR